MSKAWPWWLALGAWVTASVATHLFYIKRIRFGNPDALAPVVVQDGQALRTLLPGALFARADANPPPAPARPALTRLARYLRQHPDRAVVITGYHTPAEAAQTVAPSLGKARADRVAAWLTAAGVPDCQISTRGQQTGSPAEMSDHGDPAKRSDDNVVAVAERSDPATGQRPSGERNVVAAAERSDPHYIPPTTLVFVRDSTNALHFAFGRARPTSECLALRQRYVSLFHPMALYFATGSSAYIRTPDNDRFVTEAAQFLRQNPRRRLLLTGHTDSVGTDARNRQLSRQRAEAVRAVLIRQGVLARQVDVVARGESQPIAPNATPEGREANRRVVMVVPKGRL